MFVLQECSICLDDFGPDQYPHCIPCGHVFCNTCLESLLGSSSTARCPICRTRYATNLIRKIICTYQDPALDPQDDKPSESESETLVWEAIKSAVEPQGDREQRKAFVEHNSAETITAAGMSSNLLIALSVMVQLVQIEEKKCSLEDEASTTQAVERSLRDRVSTLEKQLYGANNNSGTQEFKSLVADIRKMQFSIETIGKHTAKVARHFNGEPIPPRTRNITLPGNQALPSIPESPSSNASQAHPSPYRGDPVNPRQPLTTTRDPSAQPSSADRGTRPRNYSQSSTRSHQANNSVTLGERRNASRQPIERPSTAPHPNATQIQPGQARVISTSSSPAGTSSALVPRAPTGQAVALHPLQVLPPVPPMPQAPRSWTLTALCDFKAQQPNQLSMKEGEKLYLFFTSDTNGEWIWCKDETGTTGFAPRKHVRIDNA